MTAPTGKRADSTSVSPSRRSLSSVGSSEAGDADLKAFRAMRPVSLRATAKELVELIPPHP